MTVAGLSPVNGGLPVAAYASTAPRLNTSDGVPYSSPTAYSGDTYAGEPKMVPAG